MMTLVSEIKRYPYISVHNVTITGVKVWSRLISSTIAMFTLYMARRKSIVGLWLLFILFIWLLFIYVLSDYCFGFKSNYCWIVLIDPYWKYYQKGFFINTLLGLKRGVDFIYMV